MNSCPACVVINGPSAAGKSTLTTAIQAVWDEPLLRFGADELFRMLPEPWTGGYNNERNMRFADRGFVYEDAPTLPGARNMRYGPDGIAMFFAMNAAIEAMLRVGQGVIVDGQAFEPDVNKDLEDRLRALKAASLIRLAVIEVRVDDDPLAERQERHEHNMGLSLHHNRLPRQSRSPDLVIDTTSMTADDVASTVHAFLRAELAH